LPEGQSEIKQFQFGQMGPGGDPMMMPLAASERLDCLEVGYIPIDNPAKLRVIGKETDVGTEQ